MGNELTANACAGCGGWLRRSGRWANRSGKQGPGVVSSGVSFSISDALAAIALVCSAAMSAPRMSTQPLGLATARPPAPSELSKRDWSPLCIWLTALSAFLLLSSTAFLCWPEEQVDRLLAHSHDLQRARPCPPMCKRKLKAPWCPARCGGKATAPYDEFGLACVLCKNERRLPENAEPQCAHRCRISSSRARSLAGHT